MEILLIWMLGAGGILLLLMGVDKRRAGTKAMRVAEATLFAWAILGGAWGGCLGMWCFHHKTRYPRFAWGFPLLSVAQFAAVAWLWRRA